MDAIQHLMRECVGESRRYGIDHEFRLGDYTYATDGAICVRRPVQDGDPLPDVCAIVPPVNKLDWTIDGEPVAIGEVPALIEHRCSLCGGGGMHVCSCGHDHDCEECEGIGIIRTDPGMPLPGTEDRLACHYASLLREGGAKLFLRADRNIAFSVEGGEGIVRLMEPAGEAG